MPFPQMSDRIPNSPNQRQSQVVLSSIFREDLSRPIGSGFFRTIGSGVPFVDHHDLAGILDLVSWKQLTSTASLDFAVHLNFAVLNDNFRVSAGLRQSAHFQELIEPD